MGKRCSKCGNQLPAHHKPEQTKCAECVHREIESRRRIELRRQQKEGQK